LSSLLVYRGDATFYFEYGRRYKLSYLKRVFEKKVQHCTACNAPLELFPGVVFQDEQGNLLTTRLTVELVPYEPED